MAMILHRYQQIKTPSKMNFHTNTGAKSEQPTTNDN